MAETHVASGLIASNELADTYRGYQRCIIQLPAVIQLQQVAGGVGNGGETTDAAPFGLLGGAGSQFMAGGGQPLAGRLPGSLVAELQATGD